MYLYHDYSFLQLCFKILIISHFLNEKLSVFPKAIQDVIKKYVAERDRNARILSKLLLMDGLSYFFPNEKIDLALLQIIGKQVYQNFPIHFTSSHSEDLVIVAFSATGQIGIDIEFKKNIDTGIFVDFLHVNEEKSIEKSFNKIALFYSLWTKKEALIKSCGIGINADFKTIDCSKDKTDFNNQTYFFREILLDDNYSCYAASTRKKIILDYKEIFLDYNNHFS